MDKAIEWLRGMERPGGGIYAWQGSNQAYPEVTGYLIPTMIDYGEEALARRCADWLLSIQCDDGAFRGLDGVKRAFDTAAVYEGLCAIHKVTGNVKYLLSLEAAHSWLLGEEIDGLLRISQDINITHIYNMRASGLIQGAEAAEYWDVNHGWNWGDRERPHYIAYGLDGLSMMERHDTVKIVLEASQQQPLTDGLFPFWSHKWEYGTGTCTTTTCQMAILYKRYDMPYKHLIEAVEAIQKPDGGLPHGTDDDRGISWAMKFYLDAKL